MAGLLRTRAVAPQRARQCDVACQGNASQAYAARMDISLRIVAAFGAVAVIGAVSGCSGNSSTSAAPPGKSATTPGTSAAPSGSATAPATATTAAAPGPALTGLGATLAQWKAAHRLDVSVPARNAYLPRLDGEDTWQVVTTAGGRVTSYTLNVAPSSLSAAETRARQELPADTRLLWARTVPGTCTQEQFESATLAAVLGDGQVNVEFDNAVSGSATPVTEELFGTYDAQTVAQAPAC